MKKSFTNVKDLIKFLKIDKNNQNIIFDNLTFPLLIPYNIAKKIQKNDLTDPLFLQFVPTTQENQDNPDFSADPLSENSFKIGNFIKKYKNRALLLCSNLCAMNCRFCFRKFFYKNNRTDLTNELNFIKKDTSIEEIILSGGDPLSLNDAALEDLLTKLDEIPHIKRIRFHTRFIIAYPKRISSQFLKILKKIKKPIIFVLHTNHPKELDTKVIRAIKKLKKINCLLLNQSVLLKGVNDSFKILNSLNILLLEAGVVPYYLHQLDKVKGSCHFEVPIEEGKKLMELLNENQSGYMVPKYVQEIAGEKNKSLI
jgi:EF-P beta-lysylation protein EpmB